MIVKRRGIGSIPCETLYIAQELVDLVIDHLQGTPDALKACCETCASMVPRSSKYLLRKVDVRASQLAPFLSALKQSPRLSANVVYLSIVDDRCDIQDSLLHGVVHLLPNLDTLHFDGGFPSFPPSTALLPRGQRRHLPTLEFTSLQLDLMECVLDAFNSVGHLAVSGHYVCGSLNSPRMAGRVRTLTLGINPAFLSGVAKMLQPSALNKVTIALDAYPVMNPYDLDPFLQACGHHIEALDVEMPVHGLQPARKVFNLGMCRRLRSMRVVTPRRQKWHTTHMLLASLPPQVGCVEFVLRLEEQYLDTEECADTMKRAVLFDWEAVRDDLAHCEQLEVLTVGFCAANATHTANAPVPLTVVGHEDIRNEIERRVGSRLAGALRFG